MPTLTDQHRFWAKVERRTDDECWLWQAATWNGYGRFWLATRGRMELAHRVAYTWLVGPILGDLEIDHLCRTRNCVNPRHMEPVTTKVNTLRGTAISAVNAAKTHCRHGHLFDEENTNTDRHGARICRTCKRDAARARRARHGGVSTHPQVRS